MDILIGLVIVIIVFSYYIKHQAKKKKNINEAIVLAIKYYEEPLATQRSKLIQKDRYGDIDESKWLKEKEYFYRNKFLPLVKENLSRYSLDISDLKNTSKKDILATIEHYVKMVEDNFKEDAPFDEDMSGHEYEAYCANLLKKGGWDAHVSKASGDQGVDILAEKDGVKVVFQCKKHKKNVGNKAVQEITAGKEHYFASYGVVVSCSGFTKSAKDLAISNSVMLLHHSQLPKFNPDNSYLFDYE